MTYLLDLAVSVSLLGLFSLALLAVVRWKLARGIVCAGLVAAGTLVASEPDLAIPVSGASAADWHPETFWYEPWGTSVVHRGIDIFARNGAEVVAPAGMLILMTGDNPKSGLYAVGIDRALRLHFFAHMMKSDAQDFEWVPRGGPVGAVGDTGNARGKPPHLHYGLASVIPRPWNITNETLGHLRAFYLDPAKYF